MWDTPSQTLNDSLSHIRLMGIVDNAGASEVHLLRGRPEKYAFTRTSNATFSIGNVGDALDAGTPPSTRSRTLWTRSHSEAGSLPLQGWGTQYSESLDISNRKKEFACMLLKDELENFSVQLGDAPSRTNPIVRKCPSRVVIRESSERSKLTSRDFTTFPCVNEAMDRGVALEGDIVGANELKEKCRPGDDRDCYIAAESTIVSDSSLQEEVNSWKRVTSDQVRKLGLRVPPEFERGISP
jgi:hypothetical protein